MTALAALIAKLEAATEGSRELDFAIRLVDEEPGTKIDGRFAELVPRYTTSLDAALTLVPADPKGGWYWRVGHSSLYRGWAHLNRYHPDNCDTGDETSANAATPALALCMAALRARMGK